MSIQTLSFYEILINNFSKNYLSKKDSATKLFIASL